MLYAPKIIKRPDNTFYLPKRGIPLNNNMIIPINQNSVKLCCGKKGCPVVEDLNNGMVKITDDDGNTIIVKKEEAMLISDGVKTIDDKRLILG